MIPLCVTSALRGLLPPWSSSSSSSSGMFFFYFSLVHHHGCQPHLFSFLTLCQLPLFFGSLLLLCWICQHPYLRPCSSVFLSILPTRFCTYILVQVLLYIYWPQCICEVYCWSLQVSLTGRQSEHELLGYLLFQIHIYDWSYHLFIHIISIISPHMS